MRNVSAKGNQKRACTVLEICTVLENLYLQLLKLSLLIFITLFPLRHMPSVTLCGLNCVERLGRNLATCSVRWHSNERADFHCDDYNNLGVART